MASSYYGNKKVLILVKTNVLCQIIYQCNPVTPIYVREDKDFTIFRCYRANRFCLINMIIG